MTRPVLHAAALSLALLGASPALAAESAPLASKALILKPLTLTKLADLDFGTIVPSGGGDFVTIDADDSTRASTSAGLIASDPGHRARFASSGLNNTFVYLQVSAPADLDDGAGRKLKVTNLTLDQGNLGLRLLTPLSQVFFVGIGGQIYVRPNQEEGSYTGTFTLTANYL